MRLSTPLRDSIKARVTLATLGVFLAILWSLAWFVTRELRQDMLAQLEHQQQSSLALLSHTIDQDLTDHLHKLELVTPGLRPFVSNKLQNLLQNQTYLKQQFSAGLVVLGQDGQRLAGMADAALDDQLGQQPYIQTALKQGRSVIGLTHLGSPYKSAWLGMAVPIKDAADQQLGVLVGVIDIKRNGFAKVISAGKYGDTGGYMLIDALQRRIIAASDPSRVMEQLPQAGVNPAIDIALQGKSRTQVFRNPKGVEVLASDQMLDAVPLVVAVVMPTQEAFAPVRAMQWRLLLATALASMLAALLVWWLLRSALAPVFDTMKQLAHMAESPLPAQALTIKRSDELGTLITAFNGLLQRQTSVQAELLRHTDMLGRTEAVANIGSWRWHVATDSVTWSEQMFRIFKRNPGSGAPPFAEHPKFYPPQDMQRLREAVNKALTEHTPFELALRILCADGSQRDCVVQGRVLLGPDKTVTELYGTLQDVTELKAAQAAVAANEARLQALFDAALDAVIGMDEQGRITHWNKSAQTIFGWRSDEAVGQQLGALIVPPQLRDAHGAGMARFLVTGQSRVLNRRIEVNAQRRTGQVFPIELSILSFQSGQQTHFTAFITDISRRREAEVKLQLAANVFSNAFEGITVTNAQGTILDINDSFTRITGYRRDEVIGRNPRLLQSGRQDKAFYQALWATLRQTGHWNGEIWNRRKTGEIYPEWLDISAVRDSRGEVQQYVALFSDITARKELDERIRQLAFFDPLTNLPNRRLLSDRLGQALLNAKRSGNYGALMFLDLDNFKPLNDAQGHATGDLLLTEVARRLQACVRQNDTVARIGGDEFVVMLAELDTDANASEQQALAIAEKIRLSVSDVYRLMPAGAHDPTAVIEHHCSCSIGLTLFVPGQSDQDTILRQADAAMYQAKAAGRNRVMLVSESTPA